LTGRVGCGSFAVAGAVASVTGFTARPVRRFPTARRGDVFRPELLMLGDAGYRVVVDPAATRGR